MGISASDVKKLRQMTGAPMMECKKALEEANGDLDGAVKVLRERGIAKAAKRSDRVTSEGVIRIKCDDGNRRGTAVVVTCETDFTAKNDQFQSMADAVAASAHGMAGDELTAAQVIESEHDGMTVKQRLEDVANAIRENMGLHQVVRYAGVCGGYVHHTGKKGALLEFGLGDDSHAGSDAVSQVISEVAMHIVASDPPPLAVDASGIDPKVVEDEKEFLVKQAMDSGKPEEIARKMVEGRMKKFYSERALVDQPFIKDASKTIGQVVEEAGKSAGTEMKINRFSRFQIGE
ncbi:MAG: translation elongation factor Ts [Planctomycetes bacterium]|nr:translation elongation factor Ts [Planctomycetota bacterium]